MKWIAILAALPVAGCGAMMGIGDKQPSSQIEATHKSELRYTMKSCADLAAERDAVYADLAAQSKARDGGASISAAKIADLKGEHNAITSMMASKSCPS